MVVGHVGKVKRAKHVIDPRGVITRELAVASHTVTQELVVHVLHDHGAHPLPSPSRTAATIEKDTTPHTALESRHRAKQRGLSGAIRPHETHDLATSHVQAKMREDLPLGSQHRETAQR